MHKPAWCWGLAGLLLAGCATVPAVVEYELPPPEEAVPQPSAAALQPEPTEPVTDAAVAPATTAHTGGLREIQLASGSQLLLPPSADGSLPLVVLFPYTGGTAADLMRWNFPKGLQGDYALLLAQGRGSADDYLNPPTWARTVQRYDAALHDDLSELAAISGLDTTRVVLSGFSMGGDLAWALALRNPQRISGALIMGSRLSYRAGAAMQNQAARGVRYYFTMGDRENAGRVQGMNAARELLDAAKIPYQFIELKGEHVPAPPEVFEQGLYYLFNEPM